MQLIAVIAFWVLATLALIALKGLLLVVGMIPSLRASCEAGGAALMRSWLGALYMQGVSLFLFVPLLLFTWGLALAAERFGADSERVRLVALPTGLLAIAVPPIATLVGALHGFKAGWFEATGRDPEADLLRSRSAKWMQRVGLGWAVPW